MSAMDDWKLKLKPVVKLKKPNKLCVPLFFMVLRNTAPRAPHYYTVSQKT